MLNHIICDIESLKEQVYCRTLCDEEIDFLKSLKDRYTWKPNDEQLEALKNAIHIKHFENPSDSILWRLYEQLKKLRDE